MSGDEATRLVIGIGNAWRQDDGAGPAVAEALAGRPGLATRVLAGEGTALIEAWAGARRVVVVDAMQTGAAAGTIRRFDPLAVPLPVEAFSCLSHRFGLPEAVEMARLLGRLPPSLTVIGIEAQSFGHGPGLSPPVAAAVAQVIAELAGS